MTEALKPALSLFVTDRPQDLVGKVVGQSPWFQVDQERIDGFARNTNDWDHMHVDPAWCKQNSPFGQPIMFGFQTLSMLTYLLNEALPRPDNQAYALNYGFDRVRLVNPVLVGSEIRATFVLKKLTRKNDKTTLNTLATTVEIKGQAKPALLADWLIMMVRK
ncbi:MAG: MaoC family dehydratase [Rhodoferax sp.]|uniref:MaoC family dehydratase n=1 Tax=Rhodoferax sp. TaxID=50421 RepID=UPI00262A8A83|nr:MaoC family dehydratase [Rhodoferax sp.]MDD5334786.1 MaoC family dehydratase [Rhodoferax sp.]